MSVTDVDKRPAFNKFYKQHIMNIHDELYKEFVPKYVTDEDFQLYFREGVSFFETGK